MRAIRYSRWDGSQSEFSLDANEALDTLSDLMMEGLSAEEALEWMRQYGFQLGGLDMAVMGLDELMQELRDQIEELYEKYRMDQAEDEIRQRLADILDREERALRQEHGIESARVNDFLARRHAGDARLSDQIERFRDHEFEDEQAGADFQELLEEQDRMRELEQFLAERAGRFRGDEAADYEGAQDIRQRIEELEQMGRDLAEGNFQQISMEQLREMLGENAARSFVLIRDLESTLRDAGYLGGKDPSLTPRAIRRIGAQALASVYNALRKGLAGGHETPGYGVAMPKPDETHKWEFGDSMDLDIPRTLLNAVRRRADSGVRPRAGQGLRVPLQVDDFEVREFDYSTQATTILLLDMSWSMSWAGRFPAAKRVALAMDQLIRSRFPRDHFHVVGFSTRAREIPVRELPEVSWDIGDPFTNLQEGLMVAEQLIRKHPSPSPQILVITDGQPTAYFEDKQLRVEWPMGFGGVSPHAVAETLKTVRRVTRGGITINSFMLDDAPELVGFVERMTQINKGRAFYTSPAHLGSFLMVDYISRRKLKRGG